MYEAEVERGMKLLDQVHPGWHNEIDLAALDLSWSSMCMCGQLYGSYGNGIKKLAAKLVDEPEDYGFHIGPNWNDVDGGHAVVMWQRLTNTWVTKIRERRELMEEFDTLRVQEPVLA